MEGASIRASQVVNNICPRYVPIGKGIYPNCDVAPQTLITYVLGWLVDPFDAKKMDPQNILCFGHDSGFKMKATINLPVRMLHRINRDLTIDTLCNPVHYVGVFANAVYPGTATEQNAFIDYTKKEVWNEMYRIWERCSIYSPGQYARIPICSLVGKYSTIKTNLNLKLN